MAPLFYLFPVFFLLSASASLGIMIISMIKQEAIRIYADTSVFGGVFDAEFEEPSKAFFGDILPVAEIAEVTAEALKLQEAYTDAGESPFTLLWR